MGQQYIDLTGQVFGKWTVLHKVKHPNPAYTSAYWLVRCECGSERAVKGRDLRFGLTTQCQHCGLVDLVAHGHRNLKDMAGLVFGQWTVREFSHIDGKGQAIWTCACACGNVRAVAGTRLRSGSSTRCAPCGAKASARTRKVKKET